MISVWDALRQETRPIAMYGMGDGAQKILNACEAFGIHIDEIFASDEFVRGHSFAGYRVKKLSEGRPNILDMITNGKIDLIINSPAGKETVNDDSYLRKAAIKAKVPYMTTIAAAKATADGIHYIKTHESDEIKSLQSLHSAIRDKA